MKDKSELDKTYDERNIYALSFNSQHVIYIPSFRVVNLLFCGGHFSNITFIDAKIASQIDIVMCFIYNISAMPWRY